MNTSRATGIFLIVFSLGMGAFLQVKSNGLYVPAIPKGITESTRVESDGSIVHVTTMTGRKREIHYDKIVPLVLVLFAGGFCLYHSRKKTAAPNVR